MNFRRKSKQSKSNFKSQIVINGKINKSTMMKLAWEIARTRMTLGSSAFNPVSNIRQALSLALKELWSAVKS